MIDINSLSLDAEQTELAFPDSLDIDAEPIEVCPFSVIVDTREQAPFHFLGCDPFNVVNVHHVGLPTGDYSIVGMESRVAIERKSISDLLGSITAGRERFEREFERLNVFEFAAVIVEGQLSDVLRHARDNTRLQLKSIVGTFDSWRIRYPRVHWIFCIHRRHAELQTMALLNAFWKESHKTKG